jgi:hypothetical protein
MSDIKTYLEEWQKRGFVNPDSLEIAHAAVVLMAEKIESLEEEVKTLLEKNKVQ